MLDWAELAGLAGLGWAGLCECKKLGAATYLTAILVDRGSAASTSSIPGLWRLPQYNTDSAPNKLALLSGERKKERKKRTVLVLRPFSDLPLAYPCLHNLLL